MLRQGPTRPHRGQPAGLRVRRRKSRALMTASSRIC
jgi:hypothetical protein